MTERQRQTPLHAAGIAGPAVPAVFLDKDGTLVEDVPFNVDPNQIRLAEGALEALTMLHAAGYALIVVTNQSGVARGYFPEFALHGVETRLCDLLSSAGIPLRGFYYCPHHPDGSVARYAVTCLCRKPAPGMLLRAALDHGIDLGASWLIGDILHDIEAGRAAGCQTILLDNGNETEWQIAPDRLPHYRVGGLIDAATVITGTSQAVQRPVQPATAPLPRSAAGGHAWLTTGSQGAGATTGQQAIKSASSLQIDNGVRR